MFATLGEALVDLIERSDGRYEPCLGGSVCNVTRALARQGESVCYLNPLSTDGFGQRFVSRLRDDGVAIDPPWHSPQPTALAVVSLGPGGQPHYTFHREAVADRDASAQALVARLPDHVTVLHTGGLALMPPDDTKALAVIAAARERGAIVSVDANLRLVMVGNDPARAQAYREAVARVLKHADVIKLSDEDLTAMGWALDMHDDTGLQALAQRLLGDGASLVAFTFGAAGAALCDRHGWVRRPVAAPVVVRDTVGAGDCFQAGLLAWFQKAGRLQPGPQGPAGWPGQLRQLSAADRESALQHAMATAAINVEREGCDPPSWREVRAWIACLPVRVSGRGVNPGGNAG